MSAYPTPWQKRTMWAALTALFVVLLIVIAGAVVYLGASLISFLQPILIPVAIAAILAYLLDPLVTELCRRKMGRGMAIAVIFTSVFIALVGLFWWVVPTISLQSANFARELPGYTQKARDRIVDLIVQYNRVVGGTAGRGKSASSGLVNFLLGTPPPHAPSPTPTAAPTPSPQTTASPVEAISAAPAKISSAERQQLEAKADKVIPNLERYLPTLADKIWNIIKKSIGGFLGVTGFLLSLIMAFQWGDWTHPLIVTIIFIVVQNLEGMFYAPRIVGKSVGLHPMTVIVSIFVWGLLIGGLLGPILAVPLTATIKVLLTRYVWGPSVRERVRDQVASVPVVRAAEQA